MFVSIWQQIDFVLIVSVGFLMLQLTFIILGSRFGWFVRLFTFIANRRAKKENKDDTSPSSSERPSP